MASLSLRDPQFETNLLSNHKVIELLWQLKSAKTHGKNYMKVRPPLAGHLWRNRLLLACLSMRNESGVEPNVPLMQLISSVQRY